MKKILKVLGIIALVGGAAFLIWDLITLIISYRRKKDKIAYETGKKLKKLSKDKVEEAMKTLEEKMDYFEKVFEDNGAVRMEDFNEKNIEEFEQRHIYKYNDYYYRVDKIRFDTESEPYIIVSGIDNEKFARIGILEELEAYPYDIPNERIEEVVPEIFATEL